MAQKKLKHKFLSRSFCFEKVHFDRIFLKMRQVRWLMWSTVGWLLFLLNYIFPATWLHLFCWSGQHSEIVSFSTSLWKQWSKKLLHLFFFRIFSHVFSVSQFWLSFGSVFGSIFGSIFGSVFFISWNRVFFSHYINPL